MVSESFYKSQKETTDESKPLKSSKKKKDDSPYKV
jgi:hypothetical protein